MIISVDDRLDLVREPSCQTVQDGDTVGNAPPGSMRVSHNGGNVSKSSRRAEAARKQVAPAAEDFVHSAADRVGPLVHTAADRVGPLAQSAATRVRPLAEAAADRIGVAADKVSPLAHTAADRVGTAGPIGRRPGRPNDSWGCGSTSSAGAFGRGPRRSVRHRGRRPSFAVCPASRGPGFSLCASGCGTDCADCHVGQATRRPRSSGCRCRRSDRLSTMHSSA